MAMDRRTFLTAALGTAGALALGGCDNPDADGDAGRPGPVGRPTIRLGAPQDFGFPSPFTYLAGPGYTRMSLLYDTLLWKDGSGELLPWLASRYERSDDGRRYTFELRDDVVWSDGVPLTAEDVAFTFGYFAAQTLSPTILAQPNFVSEVRATGNHIIEMTLDVAAVTFPEAIAAAIPIIPRHVWSNVAEASTAQDPAVLVGTGPYRLESYDRAQASYLFAARDDYFLGRPYVERIEITAVGNELTALLAGGIDAAGSAVTGVQPVALGPFRDDPSYGLIEETGGFAIPLYFNHSRGGAMADVVFRRACALAIDRPNIVERLLGGNGLPGNPGYLPPGHPFHVEVEQYPFDLEAANKLLDSAGYTRPGGTGVRQAPDGTPLRFAVSVLNSLPAVVELVLATLSEVGIELVPESLSLPALLGARARGDYEMTINFDGGVGADPDSMRRVYSSPAGGSTAVPGYANPELDDLAQRQLVTSDQAERRALIARMQEIVALDVPLLPLYYPTLYHAFDKSVFDAWYFTPGNAGAAGPFPYNKHAFITGRISGLDIRTVSD